MSTLANIVAAVKAVGAVPDAAVNYGLTDNKSVPRVHVKDYEHTQDYDCSGLIFRDSRFTVLVVDNDWENVIALADQLDAVIDNNLTLTPQAIGCFQESYRVGQIEGPFYQFGVEITYTLKEDTNK